MAIRWRQVLKTPRQKRATLAFVSASMVLTYGPGFGPTSVNLAVAQTAPQSSWNPGAPPIISFEELQSALLNWEALRNRGVCLARDAEYSCPRSEATSPFLPSSVPRVPSGDGRAPRPSVCSGPTTVQPLSIGEITRFFSQPGFREIMQSLARHLDQSRSASPLIRLARELNGLPVCHPSEVDGFITAVLAQTVNQLAGPSAVQGLRKRVDLLRLVRELISQPGQAISPASEQILTQLQQLIQRQLEFAQSCISPSHQSTQNRGPEREIPREIQSPRREELPAYPISELRAAARGCLDLNLSELEAQALLVGAFFGSHHVSSAAGRAAPDELLLSAFQIIRTCQSEAPRKDLLPCVTQRLGYRNPVENWKVSMATQHVVLGFSAASAEALRRTLEAPLVRSILDGKMGGHPLVRVAGFLPDGRATSGSYWPQHLLVTGEGYVPQADSPLMSQRLSQIAGLYRQTCQAPLAESELSNAAEVSAQNVLIHELGHAVDYARGAIGDGSGSLSRSPEWLGFTWSEIGSGTFLPRPTTTTTDGCSRLPIPSLTESCSRGLIGLVGAVDSDPTAKAAGFASAYGASAPAEDFAEAFTLFLRPSYKSLSPEPTARSILDRKFEYIQRHTGLRRTN